MRSQSLLVPLNPGVPFDPDRVEVAPEWAPFDIETDLAEPTNDDVRQIAGFLDLTLLNSDDTPERIGSLYEAAADPLNDGRCRVAGVCVYPAFLGENDVWLRSKGVRLVTVAGGFPHGLSPLAARMAEVEYGSKVADEVDVTVPRHLALEGRWEDYYWDARQMVGAAKNTPVKIILGTGELKNPETIYKAALVAMMAGAAFVKTSTGKERVNATLDAGAVLCQAIKDYRNWTGHRVGLKPAGGIRTTQEAMHWVHLVRERLGAEWLKPETFRIGASTLLDHLRYVSA